MNNEPEHQCPECSKIFKTDTSLKLHCDKIDRKQGDLCSLYLPRYVSLPPFTCLSMDGKTFMCNFGCSLVTEERADIVQHLLEVHVEERQEGDLLADWCMNVGLMRCTIKFHEGAR